MTPSPQKPTSTSQKPANKKLTGLQGAMSGLVSYQSSPSTHGDDSGESEEENDVKKRPGVFVGPASSSVVAANVAADAGNGPALAAVDASGDTKGGDVSVQEVRTSLSKISVVPSENVEKPPIVSPTPDMLKKEMEEFEHLVHLDESGVSAKGDGKKSRKSVESSSKSADFIADVSQIPLPEEKPGKKKKKGRKQSVEKEDTTTDMDIDIPSPPPPLPPVDESVVMETSSGTKGNNKSASSGGKAADKEADSPADILSVMDKDSKSETPDVQEPSGTKSKEFSDSSQKFTPRTVRMSKSKAKASKKSPEPELAPKKPPVVEWRIGFVRRDDKMEESSQDEDSESVSKESKSTSKDEISKKINILPNLPKKDPMVGLTSEVKERLARAIANVGESKHGGKKQDTEDHSEKENSHSSRKRTPSPTKHDSTSERSIFTVDLSPSKVKTSDKSKSEDSGESERRSARKSKGERNRNTDDKSEPMDITDSQQVVNRTKLDNFESDGETEKQETNSNNNGNHSVPETSSRNTRRSRRLGGGEQEPERSHSPTEDVGSRRSTRRSTRLRGGKKDDSPDRSLPSRSRSRRRGSNRDGNEAEVEKEEVEQKRSESPAIPVEQAPSRRSSRRRNSKRGDNETETKEMEVRQEEDEKPRSESPPTTRRSRRRGSSRDSKDRQPETSERDSSRRPTTPSVPEENEPLPTRRSSRRRGSNRTAKDNEIDEDKSIDASQKASKEEVVVTEKETTISQSNAKQSTSKEEKENLEQEQAGEEKELKDGLPKKSSRRTRSSPETVQPDRENSEGLEPVQDIKNPVEETLELHKETKTKVDSNPVTEEKSELRGENQRDPICHTNPEVTDIPVIGTSPSMPIVEDNTLSQNPTEMEVDASESFGNTEMQGLHTHAYDPAQPPLLPIESSYNDYKYENTDTAMDMDIGSPPHDEVPIETYHIPVIGSNTPVGSLPPPPPPPPAPERLLPESAPLPVPPPPMEVVSSLSAPTSNISPIPVVSPAIPSLMMNSSLPVPAPSPVPVPSPVPAPSPIQVISSPSSIPVIGGRSPMMDANSRSPRASSNLVSIPTYDTPPPISAFDEPHRRLPILEAPPAPPVRPVEPPVTDALPIPVIGSPLPVIASPGVSGGKERKRKSRWGPIENNIPLPPPREQLLPMSTLIPLSPTKQDNKGTPTKQEKQQSNKGTLPPPPHLLLQRERENSPGASSLPSLPPEAPCDTTPSRSTPQDDEPPALTENFPVPRRASQDFTPNPPQPPPPLEPAPSLLKEKEVKTPPPPSRAFSLTIPRKQKVIAPIYSKFAEDVDVEWESEWAPKKASKKRTSSTDSKEKKSSEKRTSSTDSKEKKSSEKKSGEKKSSEKSSEKSKKSEPVDSTTTPKEEPDTKENVESKEETCPVLVKEEQPMIKQETSESDEKISMPVIKEEPPAVVDVKPDLTPEVPVKEEPSSNSQQDVPMDTSAAPKSPSRPSAVETIMALVAEATSSAEARKKASDKVPKVEPFDMFGDRSEKDQAAPPPPPAAMEEDKAEQQIPGLGSPFEGLEDGEIDAPSPSQDQGDAQSTDGAVKSGDMEEGELVEEKPDPSTWGLVERDQLPPFEDLEENFYLTERLVSIAYFCQY